MGAGVPSGVPAIPTPPVVASSFRLSYGVAGQAAGTITEGPTRYLLHGTDTTYAIDKTSGSDLLNGYVTIQDTQTGLNVMEEAHLGCLLSNGAERLLGDADSVVLTLSGDGLTLTADYTDTISATARTRTHTFTVEGNAVRVQIEATGSNLQDLNSNYSGVHTGGFDAGGTFTLLEMPGVLATPMVALEDSGSMRYFANILDLTQSHASDFDLEDPKSTTAANWAYSTRWDYLETTAGNLHRGLREVLLCTASDNLHDCFVHPSEGTAQISRMAGNVWTFLTSGKSVSGSWTTFSSYLDNRALWGMTGGSLYPQFWWQEINYPPASGQNNGQHWYPAGEATDYEAFCAKARGQGFDVGGYTLWGIQRTDVPNYDASLRVVESDGTPRASIWGAQTFLSTEESIEAYMDLYLPSILSEYQWNLVMYDVETYAAPTKGSGSHMDSATGSPSGTLRDVITLRRSWMKYGKLSLADNAFAYGEGGQSSHKSNMEHLWAGAVDGHHKWTNTNSNKAAAQETDETRTVSNWYTTPEHEWAVINQYFANTGDLPARFFSPAEILELQSGGVTTLAPYSRAMNDRMRAYSILLGRAGSIHIPGDDVENFLSYSEQVKEYYITNTLTSLMRDGSVPEITYQNDTYGYETFSERLQRRGMTGFRNPRIRMVFGSGYRVYVNRSSTDWVLPDILGADVTLPEDGFICYGTVQGEFTIGGSCHTPGTGGQRVDFCIMPNGTMIADGRRSLNHFMGMMLPGGRTVYQDCANNFKLTEQNDGSIQRETGSGSCTTPGAIAAGFEGYEAAAGWAEQETAAGGFDIEVAGGTSGTLIAGGN